MRTFNGYFYKEEFARTISLYKDIKNGYTPTTYPHSFIGGTWLESNNGDRVFVVMSGNYRMSVLSNLNYKSIEVRTIPNSKRIIKEKEIQNWLLVRNKCSEENAEKYLITFLKKKGDHACDLI